MAKHLIALIAAVCLAFGLSRLALHFDLSTMAGTLAFCVALAVSFIRGTDALYFIVFAMLFSPEIGTTVSSGRRGEGAGGAVLRVEDVLLIAVGLGWLLRMAYQGRHFGIMRTPVNVPIVFYISASVVATLLGILGGSVRLEAGFFFNLKYFEYFFLFFMILAHVRQRATISRMIKATILVFFLVMIYAYTQIDFSGGNRLSAPFDKNEPNTFGGYIVLMISVVTGIVLGERRPKVQLPLSLLIAFAIPPLLFTLSRASYTALIAVVGMFVLVSRQRILLCAVLIGMVGFFLMGLPLVPKVVQHRVTSTFQKETQIHVQLAGVDLDASTSARIVSYQQAIEYWQKSPFFGNGVTGTHFIDSQYFRLLAETGAIGLGAFLLVLWRLIHEVWRIYRDCDDVFLKGAVMGFFCGIFGMMVHAFSANSFIIVRIAEPFWLLAGLIMLIPRLKVEEEDPAIETLQTALSKGYGRGD